MEAPGVAQEISTVCVPRKLVVPSGLKTGAATVSFGAVCVLLGHRTCLLRIGFRDSHIAGVFRVRCTVRLGVDCGILFPVEAVPRVFYLPGMVAVKVF